MRVWEKHSLRLVFPTRSAMATVPALSKRESDGSIQDEKFSQDEKNVGGKVDNASQPVEYGEVFDDIRMIDLGEDGKERPIGE